MPKPVYALIGSDSYLQLEKLSAILAEFPADVQRRDLDGERAELAEVLDELRSFAMFGGAKLLVMRNADAFITRYREQLEKYLATPSSSGSLVLRVESLPANQRIYKAIAKVGRIETCNPPKAYELPRWIVSHGKSAHKVTVTPEAAQVLADMIGDSLGRLDNELAKLALQTSTGRVDVADVRTGVAFQREQEMWDMTNELAGGRPAEALRRWRQLTQLDNSAEFRAVTWLAMWLEKVRQALQMKRQGHDAGSIASALKIWPREQVAPFMVTATRLGEAGVARAVDLLVDVDRQSKSGIGEAATNIERFLMMVGDFSRN